MLNKYAKYFYENLYIKSQVLYLLIAIVIIQILSNTPRANWEMLKNEKCTCSSKDSICRNFYHTNQLVNVSLKRKTETISIIMQHVTTENRAKCILCYKTVLIYDKKTIFSQNLHKSKISAGKCRSS